MVNPCRKDIKINADLAKREHNYFPVREKELLEIQACKQAAQSSHIWRYPHTALANFELGLRILGLVEIAYKDIEKKSALVRDAIVVTLEQDHFVDAYIRCLKRLNFKDFAPLRSNKDMKAWDEHWERAISANVLSLYFLKHAIKYATSNDENSLNELMYEDVPKLLTCSSVSQEFCHRCRTHCRTQHPAFANSIQ